ncbi:MAG TPA: carbohydrate kinase family protein [Bacilli bacterium]|nr:carbohydrate kinase family protein [Bacilli bacterium]
MAEFSFSEKVVCIGAAHVDRKAAAQSKVELHTSIPVSVHQSLGGVARNVAENLARLGCGVSLVSRLGNDQPGEWVRRHSTELGMNVSGLTVSDTRGTASYTALLDEQGEMVLGLADMEVYDEFTPALLPDLPAESLQHPVWFLDTNLPKETLEALLAQRSPEQLVFLDPVSNAKAKKLNGLLCHVDFFFPNRDEAQVLTGVPIRLTADVQRAGEKLVSLGAKHVIITLGAQGVCVVSQDINRVFPALPAQVRDVTGAGDSLLAGFICGYLETRSIEEAVACGIATASLTVESAETVRPDLTAELVLGKSKKVTREW